VIILAIDPGTVRSAWLAFDTATGAPVPGRRGIEINADVLDLCRRIYLAGILGWYVDAVVIEQVASYGMPVGETIFTTVLWCGRFAEAASPLPVFLVPRMTVRMALCHSPRANDATVRQALIDRFGGDSAIGRKATPGPLYGFKSDLWQALGLAVCWAGMEPDDQAAARLRP